MKPKQNPKWHAETKRFFKTLHAEWTFPDDEERVVMGCCENLNTFWLASDQLEKDGLTFTTENGLIRKHPGTEIQKNAWAAFLAGCRLLGICKQSDDKKQVGRPPGPGKKFEHLLR
jgi:phage terminase small subunit